MRAYLKSLLEPHADVVACADGEAAFELLRRDPPDLLLSDVMMPKLDGFGLIARIRATPALRDLAVILLSARAGEEAKVEGLRAGADDYLIKPFAANELLARVQRQVTLARERRQHQEQLAARETYFRSLVDASPVILWTADATGYCNYISQRWYDYTGRSEEQDLDWGWIDSIHPDDAGRVREHVGSAFAAHTPFSIDYRLRHVDGNYRWVIDAGMPRTGDDGRPAGFVGTVVDVHERSMLQYRLEQVARAGDIGVWYADAPFTQFQLNAQIAAHLGLDGQRVVPVESLLDEVGESDRVRFADRIAAALRDGAPFDLEFQTRGSARWLRAIGWCDVNEQGQPVRFDGVTLDISAHKGAESDLQHLAHQLTEKNRMQSEFLFTLAHELRNPLAPIRTGLELMRIRPNGQNGFDGAKVHEMMQRQVDHMVHLVDDLLDMARLSEGKVELKRAAVNLDQVVREALEISMPLVTAGAHQLNVRLPEATIVLCVDRHRIAQVLSNLVNNSAKYTPRGGRIVVEARVEGDEVAVSVLDNGIGIDVDLLPTVFDMYVQAQTHHTIAQGGGLGVGLNLVRRLVELHGGRVSAESAGAGQGSRFTVHLPLASNAPATDDATVSQAGAAAAPAVEKLRVLVVDDNIDAALTLGDLLDMSGYQVTVAHDGAGALALAARDLPHVVFLDIGLPDQTGFDVALSMRAIPGMQDATLVALTGWGADQDRQRSSEAGFNAHLTKPADFAKVEQLLQDAVARR